MHLSVPALVAPQSQHAKRHVAAAQLGPCKPALLYPVRHHARQKQAGGDRQALKVLGLAAGARRNERDSRVEPSETGQTSRDEDEERDAVEGCAESEREGKGGWRHAEGDEVGERVHLLPEHRGRAHPAGDFAVQGVKAESENGQQVGKVERADGRVGGRGRKVGREGEESSRCEDRQRAADTIHNGDEVGRVEVAAKRQNRYPWGEGGSNSFSRDHRAPDLEPRYVQDSPDQGKVSRVILVLHEQLLLFFIHGQALARGRLLFRRHR